MNIPDCYDPIRQAEALAAEHDRRRAAFPKCDLCCRSLYDDDTYLSLNGNRICERCVGQNTHSTDNLTGDQYELPDLLF